MAQKSYECAIIGAGIAGIATAYYLLAKTGCRSVVIIDSRPPMSFTSAQSGDNYRNWWPHPVMRRFMDTSIDLLEELARDSANCFNLTRRGYALATRKRDIDELVGDLTYSGLADSLRHHEHSSAPTYQSAKGDDWRAAPLGVDILSNQALIQSAFPSFAADVANVVHIRRGGEFSGQQLGQYMLEQVREVGHKQLRGQVWGIERSHVFEIDVDAEHGRETLTADVVVNAAGPFIDDIAAMLGGVLPTSNVFQQKLAFEDSEALVSRRSPFVIDLDEQLIAWTDEEREALAADPTLEFLTRPISGGVHCRPEGGLHGRWVKLGWAYNTDESVPLEDLANEPRSNPVFPEIVLRGAASLTPALQHYVDAMPSRRSHYGGYYTMTEENWPLIGPMNGDGAFVVGALSGFGSMGACAAGSLCADWIAGAALPDYARPLSLARYEDTALMCSLLESNNKGLL